MGFGELNFEGIKPKKTKGKNKKNHVHTKATLKYSKLEKKNFISFCRSSESLKTFKKKNH